MRLFDSEQEHKCSYCGYKIKADEPKLIFGTGNSLQYIRVYHPDCDSVRRAGREAAYREWCRQMDPTRKEII
jgi:hypothetical protein